MSRYALRAGGGSGRRPSGLSGLGGNGNGVGGVGSGGRQGDAAAAELAALAAIDAGLLPSSVSKEEMKRFASAGINEYLEAR